MRTIGFILFGCVLFPTANLESPLPFDTKASTASFIIPRITSPFTSPSTSFDSASLKQSNWYAQAIGHIEESEYGIKYDEATQRYASPNRKQGLRSFYSAKTFSLLPSNDSTDKWRLELTTKGVYANNKLIYAPDEHAVVTEADKIIQFDHNNNFTIEYINSKEGVRQNFIIQKEPIGKPQTLKVKLQTNKGWFVNKVHDREIHFAKETKSGYDKKITYNGLKVWDATNKELEASFSLAGDEIAINVNTTAAVYPITIDPLSTGTLGTPDWTGNSADQTGANYGINVASAGDVNGDGYSDVIVGAFLYDNGANIDEGRAYVYHGSATGLSATAYSTLDDANQAGASFGISVNTAGDVNADGYSDVIVAAYRYDDGAFTDEGVAFVYHGSASGLAATPNSMIDDMNQANTALGYVNGVASAGDVNGDGYSDVIVGARNYDDGAFTDEGRALVYHGSASGIGATPATILDNANQSFAGFGGGVSSAGDVNGDGYSDVIVGAYNYTDNFSNEGVAFVYHGSAAGLSTVPASMLDDADQVGTSFGFIVNSCGDVNGDGYSDVVVGALGYDDGANTNEGRAFVYHGSASGVGAAPAALIDDADQANASLGIRASAAGDVNGDGYSDVIVGIYFYDDGANTNEGRAFIYYGAASGISSSPDVILDDANLSFAELGSGASAAGDVNGDGYSDIIVGAWHYDDGANTQEGRAYVYHGGPDGLSSAPNNTPDDADQAGSNFGVSVASAGDVNGDGYSDVIIGAWLYDAGNNNEGVAFVYHGSATGLSGSPAIMLDGANQDNVFFGEAVASAGDVNGDGYSDVIIGADNYTDAGNTAEGRAFVYHGSPSGLASTPASLLDDADQAFANFGVSIASAGDVNGDGYSDVIVGAIGMTDGGNANEGLAYIYHGSATGLSATPNSTLNDADQVNAWFGWSVAGAGDVNGDGYSDVIIGALSYDEAPNTDEGRAFVYHGGPTGVSASPNNTPDDANQAFAQFGESVATAGDVNGDGYSDVIIGAKQYDDGFADEGRAFVYYGSSAGLNPGPGSTPDDADQATAHFGISVACAGDVNGDGYSDVIIGARFYDGGLSDEGQAFVYYGSATGLSTLPGSIPDDADQASTSFGYSVACAGDVNGDGYSDVIVGAYLYDGGTSNEGQAFVYYGNNNGGLRNNLRLYNADLVTPIQRANIFEANHFGAGLFAKSALGRVKARMSWEVKKQGDPFSGSPITNSTAFTGKQSSWFDLGIAGTELKNLVQKVHFENKVRVRVEYNKATAITGQLYGPWRYPAAYLAGAHGMNSTPLPVKFISFTVTKQTDKALLKWITVDETAGIRYEVQHSVDGNHFTPLATVPGLVLSRNEYNWVHTHPAKGSNFYRIRAIEHDQFNYSATRTLHFSSTDEMIVYPQPAKPGQTIFLKSNSLRAGQSIKLELFNSKGQTLWIKEMIPATDNSLPFIPPVLPGGIYWLKAETGDKILKGKLLLTGR